MYPVYFVNYVTSLYLGRRRVKATLATARDGAQLAVAVEKYRSDDPNRAGSSHSTPLSSSPSLRVEDMAGSGPIRAIRAIFFGIVTSRNVIAIPPQAGEAISLCSFCAIFLLQDRLFSICPFCQKLNFFPKIQSDKKITKSLIQHNFYLPMYDFDPRHGICYL